MSSVEPSSVIDEQEVVSDQKHIEESKETKPTAETDKSQETKINSNNESTENEVLENIDNETDELDDSQSEELDIDAEALQLLNTGKRHMACDDYPQAVEALAEASELLSEKYGPNANEVGESYFYYGKSLLELARMENGVLGNALNGVTPEEENEADLSESDQFEKASKLPDVEREAIVTDVYSAMAAEEKAEADPASGDKDSSIEDVKEDGGDLATSSRVTGSTEEAAEAKTSDDAVESVDDGDQEETSSQEDGMDADDIPNLQLAWEILELAKVIYLRQADENSDQSLKVRLSDVYRALGEVSLETGTSEQAIQDMTSCLDWQSKCMSADDRRIAETHYQLGNAHTLLRDYTKAIEHLRKSVSVLEARIASIDSSEETEKKESLEKERREIQALLPDVLAKVEDVEDESRHAQKAESEVKAMLTSGVTSTIGFGDGSSTTQAASVIATKANDISNLVRKRKADDKGSDEVKKVKQEMAHGDSLNKENGTTDVASTNAN